MANYSGTMSKAEDAAAYMLGEMTVSNLTGVNVYKGGSPDEITLPAIVISADRIAPSAPGTTHLTSQSKIVDMAVKVLTEASDTTRATHALICGDVEAIFIQSQDQAVAVMTAAAISGFTPKAWYFVEASPEYQDNRRETIYRFQLEAAT